MMRTNINQPLYLLAAAACLLFPTPGAFALFLGIFWAVALSNPLAKESKTISPYIMQVGIVCLGAAINLSVLLAEGTNSFVYTFVGVALTLFFGLLIGRALGAPRDTSLLLCAGTAICGGSAIVATAVTTRAKPHDISLALAIVFTLNAVALFVFPSLGHALSFSEKQFGLLAGLAIHDTSSVVGAGMAYGPIALEVATTAKLTRVLWIIPVALILGYIARHKAEGPAGKFKIPWFVAWFIVASAIFTYVPALQSFSPTIQLIGKRLMVLALFLIGSGLDPKALKTISARPLFQGIALWLLVTTGTAAAISIGWID